VGALHTDHTQASVHHGVKCFSFEALYSVPGWPTRTDMTISSFEETTPALTEKAYMRLGVVMKSFVPCEEVESKCFPSPSLRSDQSEEPCFVIMRQRSSIDDSFVCLYRNGAERKRCQREPHHSKGKTELRSKRQI